MDYLLDRFTAYKHGSDTYRKNYEGINWNAAGSDAPATKKVPSRAKDAEPQER